MEVFDCSITCWSIAVFCIYWHAFKNKNLIFSPELRCFVFSSEPRNKLMGCWFSCLPTAVQNHNEQKACELWCVVTSRVFSHELLSHCTNVMWRSTTGNPCCKTHSGRLQPDWTCLNKAVLAWGEGNNEGRQAHFFKILFIACAIDLILHLVQKKERRK